jgi:serine/threonine kinase 3
MIVDDSTLVPDKSKGTSFKNYSFVEELRTMVINSDGEDDSTMKSMYIK